MPRLLTFLPCEKVLFGENQSVSLIIVLSEFHFVVPSPEAIKNLPPKSGIPFRWVIFMQWEREGGDSNEQEFECSVAMTSEAGEVFFTNTAKFSFQPKDRIHRQIGNFDLVPVLPEGRYELVVRQRKDESAEWIEASRYPVWVVYDPVPTQGPVTASTT
jgi:hypothetical protein